MKSVFLFSLFFFCVNFCYGEVIEVSNQKVFKKYLRTHVNILVFFKETSRSGRDWAPLLKDAAEETDGLATILQVDCSASKKLCKWLKVSPAPTYLKHYRDGKFHKNYDRLKSKRSIIRFLTDPTGDIPWDEDSTAGSVVHLDSKKSLAKLITNEKTRPILVMFYAPWCGYCKQLKPEFAAAAQEMKNEAVLAGMDVDKPELVEVRQAFNITGFPTLIYCQGGKFHHKYGGENNKDGIIQWLRNPQPPKEPEKEKLWAEEEGAADIHFLTTENFAPFLKQHPSTLVMFYAPWCGHCKAMKPAFGEVATKMKKEGVQGAIAAVDATTQSGLAEKFKVQGFPTVKYFKDGEFAFDFNERATEKLLEFMKDPKEPPPPPPPEPHWSEQPSEVLHLTSENFHNVIRKKKHVLTMFYAPWCGHCKKAKPEYTRAAEVLKENRKVAFAAVDCTVHSEVCTAEGVSGYPTFHHYEFGKKDPKGYGLGREEEDFVAFMSDPANPKPVGQGKHWKALPGFENLIFLDSANFEEKMAAHDALFVKFYAPWCGHCKAMKPAFVKLAGLVKEQNLPVGVASVDATEDEALASKFSVSGYPTILYITKDGTSEKYRGARSAEDMLTYIDGKLPKEPSAEELRQEQERKEREEREREEQKERERKKKEEKVRKEREEIEKKEREEIERQEREEKERKEREEKERKEKEEKIRKEREEKERSKREEIEKKEREELEREEKERKEREEKTRKEKEEKERRKRQEKERKEREEKEKKKREEKERKEREEKERKKREEKERKDRKEKERKMREERERKEIEEKERKVRKKREEKERKEKEEKERKEREEREKRKRKEREEKERKEREEREKKEREERERKEREEKERKAREEREKKEREEREKKEREEEEKKEREEEEKKEREEKERKMKEDVPEISTEDNSDQQDTDSDPQFPDDDDEDPLKYLRQVEPDQQAVPNDNQELPSSSTRKEEL